MTFYLCGETSPTTLALPTISTISNSSIASFNTDLTENLVSCVCEVASGSSEINVTACGKNLVDLTEFVQDGGNFIWGYRNVGFPLKSGITYTFSISDSVSSIRLVSVDEQTTYVQGWGTSITYTPSEDVLVVFRLWETNIVMSWCQLEMSSTATTHEPFNSTTYNIPFDETLSGDGTFDVLSGVLTRSDDTTKQLNANYIQTNNGINNVYCDTGDISECKYIQTLRNKYL